MANTTIPLSTMYGGVSRQAPTIRFPNQVQEADNVLLSVRDGATKRPGSEMQFAVPSLVADADYKVHIIHRDESEQYLAFIGQGDVRVFDLDGNEFNVLIGQMAQAYLIANSATPTQLRAVTIADSTILLNTTVKTGWLEAPRFTTATEHKHYEHMRHHTHDESDYDRTLEAEGGYAPGYWRYDPGDGTFATITFDPVSGTYADYTNYSKDAWNPGGFKANFVRYTLAVTNATWNAEEFTITLADVFANYEWRSGDQIKMTGGTDVVAGWYEILSKENDSTIVVAETIGPAADQTDVDGTHIGIQAVITMAFWERDPGDMWEIGDAFMAELHKTKGLEDALVDWDFTDETAGYFVITCPWRGQNATMLATEAPDAGYDFTATGRPFSLVGGEYTITAGTGNPATDYLSPDDRWSRVPASGQPKALLDPAKMPVRMARDFPPNETYRNNIMADYPFAYWRLGEIIPGTGDGLTGNYYNNSDFTDFALTRIDTTVDFDWGAGSPDTSIGADWFSVRWTGEILPQYSETYTFKLFHDDGVRLWVNDVLVVDNPGAIPGTDHTTTGTIALTAATRYSIKLEYQEFTLTAKVKLYWSAASQAEQIIPQARLFSSTASGTDVLDEVGGNHGSYVDTPTLGATGAISGDSDTAVTFGGTSEYANVGTLGKFGSQMSGGVTLEAWIKTTDSGSQCVMGAYNDVDDATCISLYLLSTDQFSFAIRGDSGSWLAVRADAVIDDGAYHHVCATWDPATNKVAIYLDGIALRTEIFLSGKQPTGFVDFTEDFFVGANDIGGIGGGLNDPWTGTIDEAAIYSHALSDNIVLQHYLFGTGDTSAFFRIDTIDWKGRFSGNQFANPLISIIENEKPISDIGFHRNRFVVAGDENIAYSQAADYFNFFLENADDIADADPIDIALPSSSATKVAIVDHVVSFDKALVVFTKAGQQFETNTPEAFTYNTASLTASTAYKTIPGVRAVPMGSNLYFPAVRESTTQLYEYFYSEEKAGHDAFDVSEHCAGYLPTDIQSIAASLNNNIVLLLAPDDNKLYVYHYYWDGEKKVQSAWARYIFGAGERIVDMGVIENNCWMLVENADGFFVTSMAIPGDAVAAAADTSTSEDFTGYTETDTASRATVTGTKIAVLDVDSDEQLRVIADKGASYFGWYFKHEFEFKLGAATGAGRMAMWALTNTLASVQDMYELPAQAITLEIIWNASEGGVNDGVRLGNSESWAFDRWSIRNMAVNTSYYVTMERVATDTVECRIYSDSMRTIELATLSVPVSGGRSYRYIQMATTHYRSDLTGYALDIDIENLEFFERAWPYLVHLDNRVELTGVYGAPTTTWTLPVEDTSVGTAVLGPSFGASAGTVLDLTRVNSTTLTATGDYSGGAAAIGRKFAMNLELSRPYRRGDDGAAILDMTLTLMKLLTNHTNTGQYTIRVTQSGRSVRDNEFTPRSGALVDEEGNNEPGAFIMGRANDTTVSIRDESALPVIISSGEYVVDYQRRSR